MLIRLIISFSLIVFSHSAMASNGFRQFLAGEQQRPVEVAVWYPSAASSPKENIADNPAFTGVSVVRNAKPLPGLHPVLLLSHGYGGSWRNLAWLADAMAEQGYIVIATNHPGTTTSDLTSAHARQLWRRPQDLIMALERILNDPLLAGRADVKRIAAVGHSLGGWTVMELAGARFDPQQLAHDCIQHAELSSCRLMTTLGLDNRQGASHLSSDLQDRRIKAVVALDLGLARGLTTQSLGHIRLPVLILAAGVDSPALPASLESQYLAKALSSDVVTYSVIPGATHFSFMQQCKPQGEALIEQSAPGEGEVCRDGQGVNRNALHNMLIGKISAFLNTALHYHP